MIGLQFSDCKTFLLEMHFANCSLDYCSFDRLNLKHSTFQSCSLVEADFSSADLAKIIFDNCELLRATFIQTTLKSTDFRSASNYSFDPENNTMEKAKFALPHVLGLLSKYNITIQQ
jgi:uncharacterized protein YjbI with pentapeptide repeats